MFKRLTIAALLLFAALMVKADDGQKVISKVEKVTVFLKGAQVTRTAVVGIKEGTTDLIFEGVPQGIDDQSIQVHAAGSFTIMSVKQSVNYFKINDDDKRKLEQIEVQQNIILDKIAEQREIQATYQAEQATLLKNEFTKPENQFPDVVKLRQSLDFQTKRLVILKEKQHQVAKIIKDLEDEAEKYRKQAYDIQNGQKTPVACIIVTVYSKKALQSDFTISYLVSNATWYPSYDLRAKNVSSPLIIVYKANILQRTGEDWNDVKLTLSTALPMASNVKPQLNPYYVDAAFVNVYGYKQVSRRDNTGAVAEVSTGYSTAKVTADLSVPLSVNMVENQTNVEFNIDNTWSFANDGKPRQVEINQVNTKASYQYYVVPKINTDVFLTAQITDLNKYNLLSGPANLFFDDTYVGKSQIDTRELNDTLNVSLGIDKSILVKRTLQKELTQDPATGPNKRETRSWMIEVKNRKNQKINLLVEDQVPVSQNSAVEIESKELSGGKTDALTGKVSWNLLLNSQDNKKLLLTYVVKYPKTQELTVQLK